MKKISPTPRSITHKNPIKISPSSSKDKNPNANKYIPAKYHKETIFMTFTKKHKVKRARTSNKKISFNTEYTFILKKLTTAV